jgi:hypothetical protein
MADAGEQPAPQALARALELVDELVALVEQLRAEHDADGDHGGLDGEDLRDAFKAARLAPPRRVPGLLP